LMGVELV